MDFLNFIWYDVLYRPVYNLVIFTYQTLPGSDMGLTIIYLAVLVRILLLPASLAGSSSAKRVEALKPQLDRLARMPEAGRRKDLTRKLLRRNRVNIYATALVLGAQLAFLAILLQVFQSGFTDAAEVAYFTLDQAIETTTFIGGIDLANRSWVLAGLAAGALYALLNLTTPEPAPGAKLSDVWYVLVLPIVVFLILLALPASKALFLLTSVLFSIALYVVAKYIFRVEPPNVQSED